MPMPPGADANNCRDTGLYYFDDSAAGYGNLQSTGFNHVIYAIKSTPARYIQVGFCINTNTAFMRTTYSDTEWSGSWKIVSLS
jgi:hypothetical protein